MEKKKEEKKKGEGLMGLAARLQSQHWHDEVATVGSITDNRKRCQGGELTVAGRRLQEQIASFWSGEVLWHRDMAPFTTFRVGGPAMGIVFPDDRDSLGRLVRGLEEIRVPWWVIGRGSNILVPDAGLPGIVIVIGKNFSNIDVLERFPSEGEQAGDQREHVPARAIVRVEAGCRLAKLVRWGVENSFSGFEFAAGIPGSIGGAVVMNAGAWGREISELLLEVTVMDRQGIFSVLKAEDLIFGYRRCRTLDDLTVVDATFAVEEGDQYVIDAACQVFIRKRLEKQPLQTASAGSFFKNPSQEPAGRLIEKAGLKGYRIGGAMVSEKHANFIVNIGNASALDIYTLMTFIQTRVYDLSGIMLEPEVRLLGVWPKN